ncbi:MAG: haloacid dehalogenase-like hydrolase [Clostridia bacterium]|nr:haloacid dehalogenase-like hydrolase [Clostridia bacterium]
MNVYDFDGTIYNGDSTIDFYLFCLRRNPILLSCLVRQGRGFLRYVFGKIDKTKFKEEFFCFLRLVPDIDSCVKEFWNIHEHNIQQWYLLQKKPDDLIISASPEFLLKEICNRIEIKNLIASVVDSKNGHFLGENCHDIEKVIRYNMEFCGKQIDAFYSDSKSDEPIAKMATKAFLVKGDVINIWE